MCPSIFPNMPLFNYLIRYQIYSFRLLHSVEIASYTIQQHVGIVELFYVNQRSVKVFLEYYVNFMFYIIVHLFVELSKNFKRSRKWKIHTRPQWNIDLVCESNAEDHEMCIKRHSQQIGITISGSRTWHITLKYHRN